MGSPSQRRLETPLSDQTSSSRHASKNEATLLTFPIPSPSRAPAGCASYVSQTPPPSPHTPPVRGKNGTAGLVASSGSTTSLDLLIWPYAVRCPTTLEILAHPRPSSASRPVCLESLTTIVFSARESAPINSEPLEQVQGEPRRSRTSPRGNGLSFPRSRRPADSGAGRERCEA